MTPDERRDRWMVARARINVARQNAADLADPRMHNSITGAIDELDRYLDAGARAGWSGSSLVFPGALRPEIAR